jgi:hypothetical protein
MSATVSSSPLDDSQTNSRTKRLSRLAFMVFTLMKERWQGGTITEFDGIENAGLIEALRACSAYTGHIDCVNVDDLYDFKIEGIDGHNYIIRFSLFGPGFSVHAARVRLTKLSMPGSQENGVTMTMEVLDVLEEYSKRIKLGKATTDHAFLVGMSLIIGFMDIPGDDEQLKPLIRMISPSRQELREIRAKLPPSSTNYDEEGDQPF